MLRLYTINKRELKQEKPDLDVARSIAKKAGFLWIDVAEPTPDELSQVCAFFHITPAYLEEVFNSKDPQRRRESGHILIHLPIVRFDPDFSSYPLVFGASLNAFLTYRDAASDGIIEEAKLTVESHLRSGKKPTAGFVACLILDGVCDDNVNVIKHLRKIVEQLEIDALTALSKEIVLEVFTLRRHIDEVRDILVAEREITDSIREGALPYVALDARNRSILGDALAEIGEHMSFLQTYDSALLATISIRDLELSTRMTKIVTVLTVAATVLLLPNTVATIFGVPYFPLSSDVPVLAAGGFTLLPWQFVMILVVLSTVIPLLWVWKKGWGRV